jgi:hypothetical protein
MNEEQRKLARRLAAHPRWRWRRGMTARSPEGTAILIIGEHDRASYGSSGVVCGAEMMTKHDLPQLTDPAMQGWLMQMLREALDELNVGYEFSSFDIYVSMYASGDVWSIQTGHMGYQFDGRSLGEAAADGLLSVWGEP